MDVAIFNGKYVIIIDVINSCLVEGWVILVRQALDLT